MGGSVHTLAEKLGISPQALHRHLKTLLDENELVKSGRAPHVQYLINDRQKSSKSHIFGHDEEQYISNHFMQVSSAGQLMEGVPAFVHWCKKHKLDPAKTAGEYLITVKNTKYTAKMDLSMESIN